MSEKKPRRITEGQMRVMKLLMTALSVPGRIEELTEEQKANFIKVMGVAADFGMAFAKASFGAGMHLPLEGRAFLSVNDSDKLNLVPFTVERSKLTGMPPDRVGASIAARAARAASSTWMDDR